MDSYAYWSVVTNASARLEPKCPDIVRTGFNALQISSPDKITQKLWKNNFAPFFYKNYFFIFSYFDRIPLCSLLPSDPNQGLYELEALIFELFADYGMYFHYFVSEIFYYFIKNVCYEKTMLSDE